jgi:hypothetical protein
MPGFFLSFFFLSQRYRIFAFPMKYIQVTTFFILILIIIKLSAQSDTAKHYHLPDSSSFVSYHLNLKTHHQLNDSHHFDYEIPFFFSKYSSLIPLSVYNGNAGSYSKSIRPYRIFPDDHFHLLPFCSHLITSHEDIIPLVSERPATNAFYGSGQKKEQHFQVFHTQKIDSVISMTINYKLISAPGLYANQRTNQSHFYGYVFYKPLNNRYIAMAGITMNKIDQRENGGIAVLNQFEDFPGEDRLNLPVNFYTAERRYKSTGYFLKQYYRLTKQGSAVPVVIGHQFNIRTQKKVFTDTDPLNGSYLQLLLDSASTYDSTYVFQMANTFSFSNYIPSDTAMPGIAYHIAYRLESVNYKQFESKSVYTGSLIFAGLNIRLPANMTVKANVNYYFGNVKTNNYFANVEVVRKLSGGFFRHAGMAFSSEITDPLFMYGKNLSNHYTWDFDFAGQKQNRTEAFVNTRAGSTRLGYSTFSLIVWLNENGEPEQFETTSGVLFADVQTVLKPGKFYIEPHLGINYISKDSPLRLPLFYAQLRAGIEFPMFKKALTAFFGLDGIYYSPFQADTWSVPAGLFKLQNDVETGGFIYPGVFAGFNIKRARIFVMLENVSSGFLRMNYYAMPAYPRYDMFFRWGVSWSFYN